MTHLWVHTSGKLACWLYFKLLIFTEFVMRMCYKIRIQLNLFLMCHVWGLKVEIEHLLLTFETFGTRGFFDLKLNFAKGVLTVNTRTLGHWQYTWISLVDFSEKFKIHWYVRPVKIVWFRYIFYPVDMFRAFPDELQGRMRIIVCYCIYQCFVEVDCYLIVVWHLWPVFH